MKYLYTEDRAKIEEILEPGAFLIVIPPEEQWLAELVLRAILSVHSSEDLGRVLQRVRVSHKKEEEN